MNESEKTHFTERLRTAQAAKQAMIEKLRARAKPTRNDPNLVDRATRRAEELAQVRAAREQAKAAKIQARLDAEEAERLAREADETAVLEAKRAATKERKALSAAEAKAKRDAKYAARKARR